MSTDCDSSPGLHDIVSDLDKSILVTLLDQVKRAVTPKDYLSILAIIEAMRPVWVSTLDDATANLASAEYQVGLVRNHKTFACEELLQLKGVIPVDPVKLADAQERAEGFSGQYDRTLRFLDVTIHQHQATVKRLRELDVIANDTRSRLSVIVGLPAPVLVPEFNVVLATATKCENIELPYDNTEDVTWDIHVSVQQDKDKAAIDKLRRPH
jgi:hypothetical protein